MRTHDMVSVSQGSTRYDKCPKYLAKSTFWKHGLTKHTIESKREERSNRLQSIGIVAPPAKQMITSQPGRTTISTPKLGQVPVPSRAAPITQNPALHALGSAVMISRNQDQPRQMVDPRAGAADDPAYSSAIPPVYPSAILSMMQQHKPLMAQPQPPVLSTKYGLPEDIVLEVLSGSVSVCLPNRHVML